MSSRSVHKSLKHKVKISEDHSREAGGVSRGLNGWRAHPATDAVGWVVPEQACGRGDHTTKDRKARPTGAERRALGMMAGEWHRKCTEGRWHRATLKRSSGR